MGWEGFRWITEVSLCLQGEVQAARGDLGFLFAVSQLNTCSIYCTQTMSVAFIKNTYAQASHIMLYIQILASTDEWKWEFVVAGQCESWALGWNLFLCMASTLHRPPIIPGDRGVDGIFTRGKETNLRQKGFFGLLPDELWSSASAKRCEIITWKLLIRLSSGFCYRLYDNRENGPLFWICSQEMFEKLMPGDVALSSLQICNVYLSQNSFSIDLKAGSGPWISVKLLCFPFKLSK